MLNSKNTVKLFKPFLSLRWTRYELTRTSVPFRYGGGTRKKFERYLQDAQGGAENC